MKVKLGRLLLVLAGLIAFGTALAHTSCIYFGPECYSAQMAPPEVVEAAKPGSLVAPIGTLLVSAIFVGIGCYAFSAAGVMRPFPKLNFIIYLISFTCVVRGLLPIQLWFRHPQKVPDPVLYVGLVWLLVGLFFVIGLRLVKRDNTN